MNLCFPCDNKIAWLFLRWQCLEHESRIISFYVQSGHFCVLSFGINYWRMTHFVERSSLLRLLQTPWRYRRREFATKQQQPTTTEVCIVTERMNENWKLCTVYLKISIIFCLIPKYPNKVQIELMREWKMRRDFVFRMSRRAMMVAMKFEIFSCFLEKIIFCHYRRLDVSIRSIREF